MAQRLATTAEIEAFAPELVGSPLIAVWSPVAATLTHLATWGEDASIAHGLRTAHLATLASAGALGLPGGVTSMANGPASWSFGASASPSELGRTLCGQALEVMIRANARPGIVANTEIVQT